MTLLEMRMEFSRDLGLLTAHAALLDLRFIVNEVLRHEMVATWNATHCRVYVGGLRCERTLEEHAGGVLQHIFAPIGIEQSVHRSGLAVDLYVIEDGEISNERAPYERLGAYWKALRGENRWGGDFEGFPDLGHFSREYRGRS